jgi:hypothetical protein
MMTAGPLVLVISFEVIGSCLMKASAKQAKRASEDGDQEPLAMYVGEFFDTLSFFVLFCTYPGSCTKIFSSLFCVEFDGAGESGQRFLRVDFSIEYRHQASNLEFSCAHTRPAIDSLR